jgi:uncharacterized protein (DUF2267 family)
VVVLIICGRASMTAEAFYGKVMDAIADEDRPGAVRATAAVFHALRDRLTVEEADQLCAQLPPPLQTVWEAGDIVDRRPLKMHREEFYARVAEEAKAPRHEARRLTLAVFSALKAQISAGEADDVLAQLPKDLKALWTEVPKAASPEGRRAL